MDQTFGWLGAKGAGGAWVSFEDVAKADYPLHPALAPATVVSAFVPLAELFGFEALLRTAVQWRATCSIRFAHYQPLAQDPDSDDDRSSRVGAPRRPAPDPRRNAASVPEPDDADPDTGYGEPWRPAR